MQQAQGGYGIVLHYDSTENVATIVLSRPGSDEPGEIFSNVPCPVTNGIQTVAPEIGRACFPAGTRVLTDDGLKAIEDVTTNDRVLTHRGRWRQVEWSGRTGESNLASLRGHGGFIRSTTDHKFYTAEVHKQGGKRKLGHPEWTVAANTLGMAWATPRLYGDLDISLPENFIGTMLPDNFWWIVGRWVGDGWTSNQGPRGYRGSGTSRVSICSGKHESDELREQLIKTGWKWSEGEDRTSFKFSVFNEDLRQWLRFHFGTRAYNKKVPSWLLAADLKVREQFLQGYVSADGCRPNVATRRPYTSITTVSWDLTLGIKMLVSSLGYAPTIQTYKQSTKEIEGRKVSTQPQVYKVVWTDAKSGESYSQGFVDDLHIWGRIKKVEVHDEIVDVYDIQVAEDHSFVADGFVVHNCWVQFKGVTQTNPMITHFFNHSYNKIDYGKQYYADNEVPRFMMEM